MVNSFWLSCSAFLKYVLVHLVFDLGPRQLCEDNFVEILDSDSPRRRFCGTDNVAPFKSKLNVVTIRFKSGRNFAGSGWVLSFVGLHENQNIY